MKNKVAITLILIGVLIVFFFWLTHKKPERDDQSERNKSLSPIKQNDSKTIAQNNNQLKINHTMVPDELPQDVKNQIEKALSENSYPPKLRPIKEPTDEDLKKSGFSLEKKLSSDISARNKKLDLFTDGYKIKDDQWELMIQSYATMDDPNNEQEALMNTTNLMNMGVSMLLELKYDKAKQALQTVINNYPDTRAGEATIALIHTLIRQRKICDAVSLIQNAYETYGNNEKYVDLLNQFDVDHLIKTAETKEFEEQNEKCQAFKKSRTGKASISKNISPSEKQSNVKGKSEYYTKPDKKIKQKPFTFPGDMDKDNTLSDRDSLCAYELSMNICPTSCGENCDIKSCDVNHDNKCTRADALCIYL